MKLNLLFVGLASIVLMISCNNRQMETVELTPKQNEQTGKWGYVDENGERRIPYRYDNAWDFYSGLAVVSYGGKLGFINKTGKMVIKPKYESAWHFSESITSVKLNDKWGFIDKSGNEVTPFKYENTCQFAEGLASVKLNDKWGFIDKTGKEITSLTYEEVGYFSEGLVWVKLDDKYGFIDKTGHETVPLKYEDAGFFSEGLAKVKLDGHWGYIDTAGNEVISMIYNEAEEFSDGLGKVEIPSYVYSIGIYSASTYVVSNWGDLYYIDNAGILYAEREVYDLLEKLLGTQRKELNDYRLSLTKTSDSSESFTIQQPYLVMNTKTYEFGLVYIPDVFTGTLKYSENEFNAQSVNELKTVIIKYDFFDSGEIYIPDDKSQDDDDRAVKTFGTYLVYYDMLKKEVIGHDVIPSPNLPARITEIEDRYNTIDEIVKKIESHLTDSE